MVLFLRQAPGPRGLRQTRSTRDGWQRHCTCRTEHGVAVVAITSRQLLDDSVTDGLGEELLIPAELVGAGPIVLDLCEVEAISDAAIRVIVRLHEFVHGQGGRLVLVGVRPCVAEAFHLARLTEDDTAVDLLIPMQPDVASALRWFDGPVSQATSPA